VHFLSALVCAAVTKVSWDFTVLPFFDAAKVPTSILKALQSIAYSLDYGVLQYTIVLIVHHAIDYYRRYEEGRRRATELEAQLAKAQLAALRMQLQPHFLFNTLHAISELVHSDPEAAERMIARLSDFLRLTLEHSGTMEVSLEQELEFVKRYLEIEKMRFEERLRVDLQVDPETLQARVPNLILQPLVENALRHGVARRARDGILRIRCSRVNGRLAMQVADNGPGASGEIGEGVGLSNTRERLERLFGDQHRFELSNAPGGGFEATIEIPFASWTRSAL
jgi:two-component system LytT family sensor kinase